MRTLKFGGDLHPGDFIAVSNGNYISFGWYAGDGRGTLQYYDYRNPATVYSQYREWRNGKLDNVPNWRAKNFEKQGFSRRLIYKGYINAVHSSRVIKITHPEDLFTNKEDRDIYETSKEAMILLNLVKQ